MKKKQQKKDEMINIEWFYHKPTGRGYILHKDESGKPVLLLK
jgi:hypothetical protein